MRVDEAAHAQSENLLTDRKRVGRRDRAGPLWVRNVRSYCRAKSTFDFSMIMNNGWCDESKSMNC